MMSGAILAVPTEAAERYVPGVYKAGPERWFRLSLWGLLSQEVEASLRQPLLRELLRLPILPRLLELPLSLLSVIRRHGSRQQGLRSGRSPDWLKMKNADAPAVKREAEEDWS